MITKEKERVELNSVDITQDRTTRWKTFICLMILIVIITCIITTCILNAFNMVIYNPFETKVISVISEGKEWYQNENINLFQTVNKKGEKIIFPGQSGEYSFIVQSKTNEDTYYKFYMQDKNEDNINIKYRLKMNNTYVIGNNDTWEAIDKMHMENILASKDSKTIFTLEWKWESSDNDLEIARKGLATYTVYITMSSKKLEGDTNESC